MKNFILISIFFALLLYFETTFAQTPCDPFTAHCRIQVISLKNYPLNELSFIGSVITPTQSWALMKTPEHQIMLAKCHEKISVDENEIFDITPDKIILKNNAGKIIFLNINRSDSDDNNQIKK